MPQYGFIVCRRVKTSLIEDKRQHAEGTHSSEPQKAHPIGEFVIVVAMHCIVWPPALQLWSGRQAGGRAGRQAGKNSSFSDLKKFYIQLPVSSFLVFNAVFMLDGLILFHKSDFSLR